jgi:hypothetical protein
MRSKYKSALVALMAVCALGAVASASASAATPEFSGTFPDTFEYTSYINTISTVGNNATLSCGKQATDKGELTASKTATLTLAAMGCKDFLKKGKFEPCHTAGAKEGEVKTAALEGKPVYVNGDREVGIVFAPKAGGNFAEIECGSGAEKETLKVKGSLIAVGVKPVNVSTNGVRLYFIAKEGVQAPTEYETEGKKVKAILETEGSGLETFPFEQTGIEDGSAPASTFTATFAKATEVKAELTTSGLPEFKFTGGAHLFPKEFKGTIGASSFEFEGTDLSYADGTITGTLIGPNEVAGVVLKLVDTEPDNACYNTKVEKLAELVTNPLIGRVGYVSKSTKTVGLLLEPVSGPIANCENHAFGKQELVGSLIGGFTPVNKLTQSFNLDFETEGGGGGKKLGQRFEAFEGEEALHHIEDYWSGGEAHSTAAFSSTEINLELPVNTEVTG